MGQRRSGTAGAMRCARGRVGECNAGGWLRGRCRTQLVKGGGLKRAGGRLYGEARRAEASPPEGERRACVHRRRQAQSRRGRRVSASAAGVRLGLRAARPDARRRVGPFRVGLAPCCTTSSRTCHSCMLSFKRSRGECCRQSYQVGPCVPLVCDLTSHFVACSASSDKRALRAGPD